MSWKKTSRATLVLCLVGSLSLTGCAGWNRLVGRNDKPPVKVTLAWAKLKENEGSLTEARAAYEKVLAEQPSNVDAIMGMARLNVKAQRLVDAEQGFQHALKLQGKSPVVLSEVGKFYAQQQRWDKAVPLLQEAQRIEPHEKSHQFTLGVALAQAGRDSEAVPHFTEAVGEAAAHYNVGRILVEAGKAPQAEPHFAAALAKDPTLTDAQYFLTEIRAGRQGGSPSRPILANTSSNGAAASFATDTQQVSGTTPSRSPVAPAKMTASGRPALYPHGGYEELAPPAEGGVDSFAAGVTPASGFSPAAMTGGSTQSPIPGGQPGGGPQMRLSTTQQIPLR